MPDLYAGWIYVGGILPARKLTELVRVIKDTDSDIETCGSHEGDHRVSACGLRNWLARREKPESLFLRAAELVDGSFSALEQWLRASGMSYLRHSDAYCGIEAEIVGFVNGINIRSQANNAGDAVVLACDVLRAREALAQGRVLDAMDLLNRLLPDAFEADVPPFMVRYANGRLR